MLVRVLAQEVRLDGQDTIEVKARRSRISLGDTEHRSVRWMTQVGLIARNRFSTAVSSKAGTRSALLSRMTSAKAICSAASWLSSSRASTFLASTTVTIEIELGDRTDLVIDKESLRDRRRVSETRGLDENGIEPPLALDQVADDPDQVAAHCATDAPS